MCRVYFASPICKHNFKCVGYSLEKNRWWSVCVQIPPPDCRKCTGRTDHFGHVTITANHCSFCFRKWKNVFFSQIYHINLSLCTVPYLHMIQEQLSFKLCQTDVLSSALQLASLHIFYSVSPWFWANSLCSCGFTKLFLCSLLPVWSTYLTSQAAPHPQTYLTMINLGGQQMYWGQYYWDALHSSDLRVLGSSHIFR